MTDEQIKAISWICTSHMATEEYHYSTYKAENVPFKLLRHSSVPTDACRDRYPGVRANTRYSLNGHTMTRKKLIERLKEIEL